MMTLLENKKNTINNINMMTKKEKTSAVPFEDALTLTGFGVYNILMVILCGILVMSMIFETFANGFLVVASACELGTTNSQQGLLAAMPILGIMMNYWGIGDISDKDKTSSVVPKFYYYLLLGAILTSHFWGFIADKHGRRKTLLISLSLSFVVGTLSALSPGWIVFALLKLVTCSLLSSAFGLAVTLVSECSPVKWRKMMVISASGMFVFSVGMMAAIAIPVLSLNFRYHISFLNIDFQPWRLLSMIYTSPCLVGAIGVYFSSESPKFLLSVGRDKDALEVLKTIFLMNKRKSRDEYEVNSLYLEESDRSQSSVSLWSSVKEQTAPLFRPPLLLKTLHVTGITIIVYITTGPLVTWFPTMAQEFTKAIARGDSDKTFCEMINYESNHTIGKVDEPRKCTLNEPAMLMMFGVFFMYGVLNLISGFFIDVIGRRRLMITTYIITAACGISLVFVRGIIPNAIIYIVYMCSVLNSSLMTTVAVDAFPTYLRAMGVCLTVMVGRGSSVAVINILKYMMVNNCSGQFYLFASFSLVGMVLCYLLPKDNPVVKTAKA